jgi:hypothetical protein
MTPTVQVDFINSEEDPAPMLIFNLLGVLFAVVGAAAGAAGFWATGSPRALFLATGAAACAVDFFYRRKHAPLSRYWLIAPHHGGHLFFVPIWGLGSIVAILGLLPVAARAERNPADPRWALLNADEAVLARDRIGGDALSKPIHQSLTATLGQADPGRIGVFTRVNEAERKVLVLVKADALRKLDEETRTAMLSLLEKVAQGPHGAKDVYIGVKGLLSYGIV